ncbi:hypothetical protein AVEN_155100-1 [Araneus ventricosus]|uniref:Uncharacterized protein n=1 Tax=Araneus ventricosus TaxID=182803 RepID=A0A4Y2AA61_ARAVE|nr:hypothetical protein AVEN_155100-1 [Araneus ventricosus]
MQLLSACRFSTRATVNSVTPPKTETIYRLQLPLRQYNIPDSSQRGRKRKLKRKEKIQESQKRRRLDEVNQNKSPDIHQLPHLD